MDISVSHDSARRTTTLRIPAPSSRVRWADIISAVARAKGLDDSALNGVLPDGVLALDTWTAVVALSGINAALSPSLTISLDGDATARFLLVTLDRRALLATARRLKQQLRHALLSRLSGDKQHYGIALDPALGPTSPRLVLFVHGFHASPETSTFRTLRESTKKLGYRTGVARYPNDQPIAMSAQQLSSDLKGLWEKHPELRVSIVAKSMGGLVARAALETPELSPLNVDQLVMIATPNGGSMLAHFGFALELWEHVVESDRRLVERFYSSIEDGLGDAADDLTPGSPFLTNLNERPRNPGVSCSLLLGDRGYLTPLQLETLRVLFSQQKTGSRFLQLVGPKLDQYLRGLDEVVRGRGDGAVAIARGRLAGCPDTQVLPFDHLGASERSAPLRRAVLERLKPVTHRPATADAP